MTSPPDDGAPLRVLITNRVLAKRTGTEVYVRDLALSLQARGHHPVVYSPVLGEVAAEVRAATVPVVDDLARVDGEPDVIHGHHALETATALLAFPRAPAVFLCHSWTGWQDAPPRFPRVRRYVAVDHTCRDRLVVEHGVPAEAVRVVLNFVDLERFRPRGPLPERPRRALVFSNAAGERGSHLEAVRRACADAGLALDVVGEGVGKVAARPEEVLGGYDLVFAKARAAIEAMAVGAAVVLCDYRGAGPLVTTGNFDRLRALNFGRRALSSPVTPEVLAREMSRYDASDAAAVSRRVRAEAGRELAVDQLVALYREVVAEQRAAAADGEADLRAAAAYLRELEPRLRDGDLLRLAFRRLAHLPVVGRAVRAYAASQDPGRGLPRLLGILESE